MFEKYSVPAFFLSKDAVLASYACGKTGGLVIDVGASGTVVTPVQDGWVDTKGMCRTAAGGRLIDAHIRNNVFAKVNICLLLCAVKILRLLFGTEYHRFHLTYDSIRHFVLSTYLCLVFSELDAILPVEPCAERHFSERPPHHPSHRPGRHPSLIRCLHEPRTVPRRQGESRQGG